MDTDGMNAAAVSSEPEPRKKGTGKFLFLMIGLAIGVCVTAVLVLVLAQMKGGFDKAARLEGKGYDTPEEAVFSYARYLKAGDLDGIVSTFAMESYLENYSVEESYVKGGTFSPFYASGGQLNMMLGYESDLSEAVNLENRRAYVSAYVLRQSVASMMAGFDDDELSSSYNDGLMYKISDDENLETVLDFLNTSPGFEGMSIGGYLDGSKSDNTSGLKEYNKRKKNAWGGDTENVCMELEIDGRDYVLCMLCVCYDNKWYNAEFGNYFQLALGISPLTGGLCPAEHFAGLK
ncbi:MAG: hypothetical protein IKO11_03665 [Lachnospiraceae bacterium]|nr:hypothetical protein [Lachnospiraceae bacterium]